MLTGTAHLPGIAPGLLFFEVVSVKKQEMRDVPIFQLRHSRFNTRKTRSEEDVKLLAERIKRIGYERTRALWAVEKEGWYEVFAGGTRLEAAKMAGLKTIPVLVHVGYSEEEISRLSDLDNENDEYHRPVPATDVWAEYARLHEEEGWGLERIARVKGVDKSLVSRRIRLYHLPEKLKGCVDSGILTETHLRAIMDGVDLSQHFSFWLTTEQAMLELADKAVHDKKKNGEKSVRALESDVSSWKEWIVYAEKVYKSLEEELTLYDFLKNPPEPYVYRPREEFVQELSKRKARSLAAVKEAELAIRSKIADGLEQYRQYLEEKSAKAAAEKIKAEKVAALVGNFKCGDARELVANIPDGSVRLLLTDPPYGINYQSNRRWASKSPEKIAGDEAEKALSLLSDVLPSGGSLKKKKEKE